MAVDIGKAPRVKKCDAIEGILAEAEGLMKEAKTDTVRDAAHGRCCTSRRTLRDVALRHPHRLGNQARPERRRKNPRRNVGGRKGDG